FTSTCGEEEFYLACAHIELMHASMGEILVGHDVAACSVAPTPPISSGWYTR
ncbi:hypothetical protein EV401DRAFT_1875454, partial [Pisolithus croceorrhizus]